jgi:exosome complex component CSL4
VVLLSEIVVPGEFLTVEEEYFPGKNTFEDEEGNIYSTKVGIKKFNEKEREVLIEEKTPLNEVIEAGSIIIGRVSSVKDSFVVLDVVSAQKNGLQLISLFHSAKLMISNVSRSHIRNLSDEFKVGDFVKAKVIEVTKYGIDVTTSFPELGVIRAFCSKCRHKLGLFNKVLKCSKCGSIERRKLSNEFK